MILTREQALKIFKRRVSTRSYDPARTISDEDFNTILEFGRLSPSSVGSEPWKFLVIQNKELREKLKPIAWGMVNTLDDASHRVKKLLNLPRNVEINMVVACGIRKPGHGIWGERFRLPFDEVYRRV